MPFPQTIPAATKNPLNPPPPNPPFLNLALGVFLSRISDFREPPPPPLGGLYASAWLGIQPWVRSVAEVSRFASGVGLEAGSGCTSPTPGACVELLVW